MKLVNQWDEKIEALFKENGFINICFEALDRHADRNLTAIRFVPPSWSPDKPQVKDISYPEH